MDNSDKNVLAISEKLDMDQKDQNNNTVYRNTIELPRHYKNIDIKLPSLYNDENADDDNDDANDVHENNDRNNDSKIKEKEVENVHNKNEIELHDVSKTHNEKSSNKDSRSNKTFSLTSSAHDGVSENVKAIQKILCQFKSTNISTKAQIAYELEQLGSYMLNGDYKSKSRKKQENLVPIKCASELQKVQMYLLYILEHVNQNLTLIESAQVQITKIKNVKVRMNICEPHDMIMESEDDLKESDTVDDTKTQYKNSEKYMEDDILSVEELSWDENFLHLDKSRKSDASYLFKSFNTLNIKNMRRSPKYGNGLNDKNLDELRTPTNSTISLASSLLNSNREDLLDPNAQIDSRTEIIEKSTSFTELKNRFEKLKFNNAEFTKNQNHNSQHILITTSPKCMDNASKTTSVCPYLHAVKNENKEVKKNESKSNLSYHSSKTGKDQTFETRYEDGPALYIDPPHTNQEEMIDNSAFLVSSIESVTMDSTLSTAINNRIHKSTNQKASHKGKQSTKSSVKSSVSQLQSRQTSASKNSVTDQYTCQGRKATMHETEDRDQEFKCFMSDNVVTEYNSQQSYISKLKTPIVMSNERKRKSVLPFHLNRQIIVNKPKFTKPQDHDLVSIDDKSGHFIEIEQNNGSDDSNQVLVENTDYTEMAERAKTNLLLSEGELIASPNCKTSDMNIYVKSCENEPIIKEMNYHYIKELVDTERSYVNGLYVLSEVFYSKIKSANVISLKNFNYMFPESIHQMHKFHKDFSNCLNDSFQESLNLEVLKRVNKSKYNRNKHPIKIGQLFLEFIEKNNWKFFQLYRHYFSKSQDAILLYNKLKRSSPKFDRLCKTLQVTDYCSGLDLSSYLVLPIQRLPRYLMILRRILKNLDPKETDERVSILAVEHLMDSFLKETDTKSNKKFEDKDSTISTSANNIQDTLTNNDTFSDIQAATPKLSLGWNSAGSFLRRGSSFHNQLKQPKDTKAAANDNSISTVSNNTTTKLFKSKTMKKFWTSSQTALNNIANQLNHSPSYKGSTLSVKDPEKTMSECMSQYDLPSLEDSQSIPSSHNHSISNLFHQTTNSDASCSTDRRVYTYDLPKNQCGTNKYSTTSPTPRKNSPKLTSCPINSTNISSRTQLYNNNQQIDNKTVHLSQKISQKDHKKAITKNELTTTIKTDNNSGNNTDECAVCLYTQEEFEVDTCNEDEDENTYVPADYKSRARLVTKATSTRIENRKGNEFQLESVPSTISIPHFKKTPPRVLSENYPLIGTNIRVGGLETNNESKLTYGHESSAPRKIMSSLTLTTILHELLMNEVDKIINKKVYRILVIMAHVTVESLQSAKSTETSVNKKPNSTLQSRSQVCMQPPESDGKSQSDFSVNTTYSQPKKFSLRQLFSLKKKARMDAVTLEPVNIQNSNKNTNNNVGRFSSTGRNPTNASKERRASFNQYHN